MGVAASPTAADEPDPFAPILHALDYLAVDYPGAVKDGKVLDQGEYAEQVEFATSVRGMIAPASSAQSATGAPAKRSRRSRAISATASSISTTSA